MAINQFHNQTETIKDLQGNPVSLKEEFGRVLNNELIALESLALRNTTEATGGSIGAGQYRFPIGQKGSMKERAADQTTKKTLTKPKVREFLLKTLSQQDTEAEIIRPNDMLRYVNLVPQMRTKLVNAPFWNIDKRFYEALVANTTNDIVKIGGSYTGEELYDKAKEAAVKLGTIYNLDGSTTKAEFYEFIEKDMTFIFNWEAVSKIGDVPMKYGAGSEAQFNVFVNGLKASFNLNGINAIRSNRLPEGVLCMVITNGLKAPAFMKYQLKPFAEFPELTGGSLALYAELDDMIDVAFPDNIIVITNEE